MRNLSRWAWVGLCLSWASRLALICMHCIHASLSYDLVQFSLIAEAIRHGNLRKLSEGLEAHQVRLLLVDGGRRPTVGMWLY